MLCLRKKCHRNRVEKRKSTLRKKKWYSFQDVWRSPHAPHSYDLLHTCHSWPKKHARTSLRENNWTYPKILRRRQSIARVHFNTSSNLLVGSVNPLVVSSTLFGRTWRGTIEEEKQMRIREQDNNRKRPIRSVAAIRKLIRREKFSTRTQWNRQKET